MAAAKVGIEVKGAKAISRALKLLGETDAPYLREALDDSGHILETATRTRAKGGIAGTVRFAGTKGVGGALRAVITVSHPGAKAMEFGRKNYYRGFTGRRQKATGTKFRASRGQQARPFVGIKHLDQAIGASKDNIQRRLMDGIEKEWERVAGGPD